jgi:hypothetical protein
MTLGDDFGAEQTVGELPVIRRAIRITGSNRRHLTQITVAGRHVKSESKTFDSDLTWRLQD